MKVYRHNHSQRPNKQQNRSTYGSCSNKSFFIFWNWSLGIFLGKKKQENMSRLRTTLTKLHVHPAKTQISLGIRPVWSESSLYAEWVVKGPKLSSCGQRRLWSDWADAILWFYCDHLAPYMSHSTTKPTKWHVCPVKTKISLGIHPVWSVFAIRIKKVLVLSYLLSAQWRLWSDWVDAQAIWVFAGCTPNCWFCHAVAHICIYIHWCYITY